MTTYRIKFSDEVNTTKACDSIAYSCNARIGECNDYYGFIEIDEGTDIEHLERMLDEDDDVIGYDIL